MESSAIENKQNEKAHPKWLEVIASRGITLVPIQSRWQGCFDIDVRSASTPCAIQRPGSEVKCSVYEARKRT